MNYDNLISKNIKFSKIMTKNLSKEKSTLECKSREIFHDLHKKQSLDPFELNIMAAALISLSHISPSGQLTLLLQLPESP